MASRRRKTRGTRDGSSEGGADELGGAKAETGAGKGAKEAKGGKGEGRRGREEDGGREVRKRTKEKKF